MGLKITGDAMVFATTFGDRVAYSIGISRKKDDGSYEKAYFPVQFKKDVVVENMTKIDIKNAWFSFYASKDDPKKKTVYLFIGEFTSEQKDIPQGFEYAQIDSSDIPF